MKPVRQLVDFYAVLGNALTQLEPIEPAPEVRIRLGANLAARIRAETQAAAQRQGFFTIRAEEGKWHQVHPGVKLKLLYRDRGTQTFLLDVAPSTIVPSHDHPSHEECYVVQGEGFIGDVRLRAGDYHFAHEGSRHIGLRSDTGAMFLIRTGADGPRI